MLKQKNLNALIGGPVKILISGIIALSVYCFLIEVFPQRIPEITTSCTTLLVVIVALFKEKLIDFYFTPDLEITVSDETEHFHEVDARDLTGKFVEKQAWLGIRIENIGIGNAKNVEAYFSGLESNVIGVFDSYKSIPLVRSWIGKQVIELLPPNMSIRWDICYLSQMNPDKLSFSFLKTPNALNRIKCNPNEISFFKFEVIALSANAKPKKLRIEVDFKGAYKTGFKVNPY